MVAVRTDCTAGVSRLFWSALGSLKASSFINSTNLMLPLFMKIEAAVIYMRALLDEQHTEGCTNHIIG